jgi:tripartite-type tricarboxylate transporter receptor subunit TctC
MALRNFPRREMLSLMRAVLVLWLLIAAGQVLAQASYPSRPIRLVNTSAAGGTGDTLARAVTRVAEKELGATIVVDNRPGATGIIGTEAVAKAEPDGYTLLQTSSSIVTNAATGRKLTYDVIRDFVQITNIATAEGYLVLVNPGVKVGSLKELVASAMSRKLLYGSPGPGNPIHFMTEALNQRAGISMTHVPYKGLAPAIVALLSGEIHVLLAPPIATRQHIASGKLRAVASVSSKRVSSFPDLPTAEELGYKGFTLLGGWQGWFAPAKTPSAIVNTLQRAVATAVHSEELRSLMQTGGYVPDGRSPAEFRALVIADYRRFSELARAANIKEE